MIQVVYSVKWEWDIVNEVCLMSLKDFVNLFSISPTPDPDCTGAPCESTILSTFVWLFVVCLFEELRPSQQY